MNLTQALADEWAASGVRVNCVNPERTGTPMRTKAFGEEPPGTLLSSAQVARQLPGCVALDLTGHIIDIRREEGPAALGNGEGRGPHPRPGRPRPGNFTLDASLRRNRASELIWSEVSRGFGRVVCSVAKARSAFPRSSCLLHAHDSALRQVCDHGSLQDHVADHQVVVGRTTGVGTLHEPFSYLSARLRPLIITTSSRIRLAGTVVLKWLIVGYLMLIRVAAPAVS